MQIRYSLGGGAAIAVAVSLTACGGTSKTASSGSTGSFTTSRPASLVRTEPAPSKQEIVKARKCLENEGVRPAKHKAYRAQIPRGTGEVTRGGLPVTPKEYESQVRRCVAPRQSARAKAVGNK